MNALGEGAAIPFLSTHPGNTERMENADLYAQTKRGAPCGSNSGSDPVMTQTK